MSALASSLLDFILSLLRDQEAAARFADNPERELSGAGLGDVCGADVARIAPMLDDFAPHRDDDDEKHSFKRDDDHEHDDDKHHGHKGDHGRPDDNYMAIERIKYITNNHHYDASTTYVDKSHWGDTYDVWADDGSTVALPGSIAIGKDAEVDGDVTQINDDSFNRVHNTGDNSQVAGGDATASGDAFANSGNTNSGSGVQINNSGDLDIEDIENNHASDGSVAGDGTIDNSSVEVDVEDVVVQVGENNTNDSENTVNQSDYVAQDVGEVQVEESVIVTEPELDLGYGSPLLATEEAQPVG